MMNWKNTTCFKKGFTVAEILIAVVIGSAILIVLVGIMGGVERASSTIEKIFDSSRLPNEILQKIAEDLDTILSDSRTQIIVDGGKEDGGYPTSRLEIKKFITDANNNQQLYERIVWQANYDLYANQEGLVLYRGHSGLNLEDKLLDSKRQPQESDYPFIPVCEGLSMFKVQAIDSNSEEPVDAWTGDKLPKAVVVSLSFGQLYKFNTGEVDVNDIDRFERVITIDRTQKMNFQMPAIMEVNEPNEVSKDVNEPNEPKKKVPEPNDTRR